MEIAEKVRTLDKLIEKLEESNPSDFPSIIKSIEINPKDFDEFKTWKKDDYTRNCIYRSKYFELILLCWNREDITPIHNHDGQKCWVYQLEGTIDEVRYKMDDEGALSESHRLSLSEGDLSYMDDRMGYHSLENTTNGRASTLHLYTLPIEQCQYFCDEAEEFKEKELTYDSEANL